MGDDSTTKIIGGRKFKLKLMDGRIITLPGVHHIQRMSKNVISIRKLDDVGVKTMFEKETCQMVRGTMVLLKGFQIGTLYNMQRSTISDGCNSSIIPDIGVEEEITPTVSRKKVSLWHQRLGHIG